MTETNGLLIRASEFSRLTGIDAGTVRNYVLNGDLKGIRVGAGLFVYRSELERLQAGSEA